MSKPDQQGLLSRSVIYREIHESQVSKVMATAKDYTGILEAVKFDCLIQTGHTYLLVDNFSFFIIIVSRLFSLSD